MHIRERRPNGQLLGMFIDDQRDPKERVTILAERGDILSNERGTLPRARERRVHRHETKQRDPVIVQLLQLCVRSVAAVAPEHRNIEYSVQERSLMGTAMAAGPTIRSSSGHRDSFAPSSSTGSPCRSIRSPSWSSPLPISARRAHAAEPRHVAWQRDHDAVAVRTMGFVGSRGRRTLADRAVTPFVHWPRSSCWADGQSGAVLSWSPRPSSPTPSNAIVEGSSRRTLATAGRTHDARQLARYFGMRFLGAVVAVFGSLFLMVR